MQSTSPSSPHIDLKIVVLGGGGVGKSSFIHRYTHNEFTDTVSTLASAFALKKWSNYYFAIWDTAGQEKFSKVSSYYCRGADAAIIAYDITDSHSFSHVQSYLEQYRKSEKKGVVVIIGTKQDLVNENPEMRQVNTAEGKALADSVGAVFFETSARSNVNIENVFNYIGCSIFPGSPLIVTEDEAPERTAANSHMNDNNREACCCIQ